MVKKIQRYPEIAWSSLCVLLFTIIAHGYRFVNLMFNGDSLLLYQTDQRWKLSIGRIFQPYYWKLRGDLVAPMLIGVLATFYLIVAVDLIISMTKLKNRAAIALLCGILSVNITITDTHAADIHESDTYMLALLCAVAAVYFFRRKHLVIGALLVCLCLGLYQAYIQVAVGLLILLFMQDLLEKQPVKAVFFSGIKSVVMLLGGSILYTLAMKLLLQVYSIELADHYNGLTNVGDYSNVNIFDLIRNTYTYVFDSWLRPTTFRSSYVGIVTAVLLLLVIAGAARILIFKMTDWPSRVLFAILFLGFPFGVNVVYFISQGMEHTLMIYSFCLIYLLAALIARFNHDCWNWKYLRYAGCAALGLTLWCNTIFSNQTYLQLALEDEATHSLMTRVVARLEQTEGYVPGETPIAIVGLMPTSPYYKIMDGFEDVHSRIFDAYTASWENNYYLYLENILNYPVKRHYLTTEDQAAVDAMPTFPADGCCAFIGDILVVKIGDVVITGLG